MQQNYIAISRQCINRMLIRW